jgi:predicted transcriptional regulator
MDEGVDPTKMCQSLVDKVFQSKQLRTVAEPDILVLFEDWLEELEEEIINQVQKTGSDDLGMLARELGLSRAGVNFLITKLKREDRI